MKYLKLLGWLALYGAIYLVASIIAGGVLGFVYILASLFSGGLLPLDVFIVENIGYVLIISGVFVLGFGALVLFLRKINPLKYLEFRSMSARDTAISILIGIGFSLFLNSLMTLIRIDQLFVDPISEQISEMMMSNVFLVFLSIGIIVPIYEEILFRGLIFKELKANLNLLAALILQGLIFGIFHGNLLQFSYTFPAGIALGIIYFKFGSIWAPILIHLAWNFTSVLINATAPEVNLPTLLIFLVVGILLLAGGAVYTRKYKPSLKLMEEILP